MKLFSHKWPIVLVLLILVLGGFFRLWMLADIPPGLYPDEAKNANDAVATLESGEYEVFYPENNGREGLQIWLTAFTFEHLGVNMASLKLVVAFAGIFAILGTYLATREILLFTNSSIGENSRLFVQRIGIEATALFATGAMATSFWHINFSRVAFRAIFTPLLVAFGLWLLFLGIRKKNFWALAASGAVWGLGMYTYIAFRFAILIPAFVLTLAFVSSTVSNIRHRKEESWLHGLLIKDKWWQATGFLAAFGAVIFPIVRYFAQNPQDFVGRATGISVFDSATPVASFFTSLGTHLQMLLFVGDHNWRHNFSGEAQLAAPIAILFVVGLIYSGVSLYKSIRAKKGGAFLAHITLLFGFGVMILPAALTIEGIPHALRAIGLMPFVFMYAAFGLLFIIDLVFPHKRHRNEVWPFGLGVVVLVILVLSSFQFSHYFHEWGQKEEVEEAFSRDFVAIGEYLNTVDNQNSQTHKYLIVNAPGVEVPFPAQLLSGNNNSKMLPMPAQTPLFIQQTYARPIANTTYVVPENLPEEIPGPAVLVPMLQTEEIKQLIRARYLFGTELEFDRFWAYRID